MNYTLLAQAYHLVIRGKGRKKLQSLWYYDDYGSFPKEAQSRTLFTIFTEGRYEQWKRNYEYTGESY